MNDEDAGKRTNGAAQTVPVAVAHGDGIGPEIMQAVLTLLEASGARIEPLAIEVGQKVYERGVTAGIAREAWDTIDKTRVILKAPITTPRGKGYKSLNVTLRKTLGLFANVRPCPTYHPFITTTHPGMDVVIVRENEEDTYGGIEHRQTREVTQCLKLITEPGSEKICRYAFEFAKSQGRKKVTCLVKDNIMKLTDGLFHEVFQRVATDYSELEADAMIVDIGAARLATKPHLFDVVVLPNLYGDIVSDIAAEISGSVGICGSANVGEKYAMFEAIHGSAPDIAGQGIANPSGLLHGAILMLDHIGQSDAAARLHDAWLRTIEDGVLTADVAGEGVESVGTEDFTEAVLARMGQAPQQLAKSKHDGGATPQVALSAKKRLDKSMVGVDVFLDWDQADRDPEALGSRLRSLGGPLQLTMITNRGTKVFPEGLPGTFCTDHWRCRFEASDQAAITHGDVIEMLRVIADAGLDFIKIEQLFTFDGEPGFSLGQGQ